MTRKRFVKLLMAKGYTRNEANAYAANARKCGIEYRTACIAYRQLAGIDIPAFCDAVRKIIYTTARVAQAITNATAAFVKAYRESMEASHE